MLLNIICRRQHLWVIKQRRYSRFTFVENTIVKLPKIPRAKFLGSDGLFVLLAYASLTASRTLLQQLLACPNFTLDSEDVSFWYKQRKWFMWTMATAQAAGNHIYISIPTWTHSQNSQAAAEALSLKISSHWTSLKWSGRLSQSARE